MPIITIPDEIMREAGLSEREALVEFACRLFDAGKISLWSGAMRPLLDRLQNELGFYISVTIREDVLRQAGE